MAEEALEQDFDMDSAVERISDSLFDKKEDDEPATESVDSDIDLEDEPQEDDSIDDSVSDEAETDSEDDSDVDAEESDPIAMPQSWKKDMAEKWGDLPSDVQEYIAERDKQSIEGLDKDRDAANLGRELRGIVSPYSGLLEQQGVNEKQAVQYMLEAHRKLSTGDETTRKAAFAEMAKAYGLNEGDSSPDTDHLLARINKLEQNLTYTQAETQQEKRNKIMADVESFASEHEHFDALSTEVARLIGAGYELDDAYRVAYRASDFYETDLQKKNQEKESEKKEAKKKEAVKSKKASSVNVRGRDTRKAPTAPKGTMADTMRETLRDIKNREASQV